MALPLAETQLAEHTVVVPGSARAAYELLADVTTWPHHFPPTVYARRLERTGDRERIQLWATANGETKTWISRRTLDPEALRIDFEQEVSAPPVARMTGSWRLQQIAPDETLIVLQHAFRAIDDDPEGVRWISAAVERNSTRELAGLKSTLATAGRDDQLLFSFADTVDIAGPSEAVYDFLYRADQWPQRLPHVERLALTEDVPGIQDMTMGTTAVDGSVHTTRSIRVCFPGTLIAYKQIEVPALMTLHTGEWRVTPTAAGTTVTSQHTVRINPDAVARVLGPEAGVADARAYVRNALGTNSRATLEHARRYAEGRRD